MNRVPDLPPLPDRELLADACRETAALERLPPAHIEKDYFLTRVLTAIGAVFGDRLLLKGGTLLSKVDLGFTRMSEDADFVMPVEPGRKRSNAIRMNEVRDALRELAPVVGFELPVPTGDRFHQDTHVQWSLMLRSPFGSQAILLEVSMRPVFEPARRVPLRQLLQERSLNPDGAACWALSADEARAEKVRAAFTRNAIRDFHDLDELERSGADFSSGSFIALVDRKLAELDAPPLSAQPKDFAVDAKRRAILDAGLKRELPAVLRTGARIVDLDDLFGRFNALWRK